MIKTDGIPPQGDNMGNAKNELLKEYAKSKGIRKRAFGDLSPLEEWLICKLTQKLPMVRLCHKCEKVAMASELELLKEHYDNIPKPEQKEEL